MTGTIPKQVRKTPDRKWEDARKEEFTVLLGARRRLTTARETLDDLKSNINGAECEVKNAEIEYAAVRARFESEVDPGDVKEKP